MGMFWNMHQDQKIRATSDQASRSSQKTSQLDDKVRLLEQRLDHLTLYSQAMWELIRENTRLEDQDILERAKQIDARDGKSDGKISTAILICPACERKNNSAKKQCMYCGEDLPREHIFES